jgi:hypothetical protein
LGGRENDVLFLKKKFSAPQNEQSDVNKTYIDITNALQWAEVLAVYPLNWQIENSFSFTFFYVP